MEIHIRQGESLTIIAHTEAGEEKTFPLSYLEMMARGEKIIDGITESEISALRAKKKILAIKLYRARTHKGLKESKDAIDEWVERNECCRAWPYCPHVANIESLALNLIGKEQIGLVIHWSFPAEITAEQCEGLMSLLGFKVKNYGFYSYRVENTRTCWSCNSSVHDKEE